MAKPRQLYNVEWGRALARLIASSRACKTQLALARKSGVAQSTIGRILRGEVNPQICTATFLAQAFRIPFKTFAAAALGEKVVVEGEKADEVDAALFEMLACREERKRAELTLLCIRRKENDAIERLEQLVRKPRQRGTQ